MLTLILSKDSTRKEYPIPDAYSINFGDIGFQDSLAHNVVGRLSLEIDNIESINSLLSDIRNDFGDLTQIELTLNLNSVLLFNSTVTNICYLFVKVKGSSNFEESITFLR